LADFSEVNPIKFAIVHSSNHCLNFHSYSNHYYKQNKLNFEFFYRLY
jgi:hypothetical protein